MDRRGQLLVARWAGCEVLPRMSKKVQALIVADPNEVTGNFQKARDYGIPIVLEPDFLVGIGIPVRGHQPRRRAVGQGVGKVEAPGVRGTRAGWTR